MSVPGVALLPACPPSRNSPPRSHDYRIISKRSIGVGFVYTSAVGTNQLEEQYCYMSLRSERAFKVELGAGSEQSEGDFTSAADKANAYICVQVGPSTGTSIVLNDVEVILKANLKTFLLILTCYATTFM